jgi:hypothetical protein
MPLSRNVEDGGGASEPGDRAPEGGEEAVAGGVDLGAAEAEELGADQPVVIGQDLLPGRVTEAAGGTSRVDDIGHEQGRHHPLVLSGEAEEVDVAREIDRLDRLVTNHPGVVPWRDVHHVARLKDHFLAVVHAYREAPGEQHLDVMHRARCRLHDRRQVLRPAPAGLHHAATDGVRPDARQRDLEERELPKAVKILEALPPDYAHARMVTQWRKHRLRVGR